MGLLGSLFKREKRVSFKDGIKMVGEAFKILGVEPRILDTGSEYALGCAVSTSTGLSVVITLFKTEESGYIDIGVPLFHLPKEKILPLYRRCLELNSEIGFCAFAIRQNAIYLVHREPLAALEPLRLANLVNSAGAVGDNHAKPLADEFGAKLWNGE